MQTVDRSPSPEAPAQPLVTCIVDEGPIAVEVARAQSYAAASRADNTLRAYASDLRTFAAWCESRGVPSLPASPASVAAYLAQLADRGRSAATISRALTAISQGHRLKGLDSPREHRAVRETIAGIRRKLGTAQRGKDPLVLHQLRAALTGLPNSLVGTRDRALLLVGFSGAFRRSELVSLDVRDLRTVSEGLLVNLRRSKTDQEGAGRLVPLPFGEHVETCPVRAVMAWIEASQITVGALFRRIRRDGHIGTTALCDRSVAIIVKAAAARAGLDPRLFAGHSLRAGLVTQAALCGKSERDIMRQTGHKSVAQVRRYVRHADLFTSNAAAGIGL